MQTTHLCIEDVLSICILFVIYLFSKSDCVSRMGAADVLLILPRTIVCLESGFNASDQSFYIRSTGHIRRTYVVCLALYVSGSRKEN